MTVSHRRKSVKILIRKDLLDTARELNRDLACELERYLEKRFKMTRAERWLEDNQEAIAAYNRHVEEHGLWNESIRLW